MKSGKNKKIVQSEKNEELEEFVKKKEIQNKVLIKIIEEINHKTKRSYEKK